MKVFLDTNALYNNWFVDNANFKLLFHYLNNEEFDLLLSNLVAQEVNNIRERELVETTTEIDRLINRVNKLNKRDVDFSIESLGIARYDVQSILKNKVNCIENISYDEVPHRQVVERALKLVKPFTGEEKGYRDTLIWLSFLRYLKAHNVEGEIAFITNNKHDFFEKKNKLLSFNDDLQKDIDETGITATVKPYLNIFDFIKENVDKIEHAFNREEILDDLEDFLIEETESYLKNMKNNDISDLLGTQVFSDKLTDVIEIVPDIFEGVEDHEVHYVSRLPEKSVYISCFYEMRRVDLVVTIDLIEFKQHVDEIESIKSIYNIEIDGDVVKLSFIFRLYIDASLEYDTESELGSSLTIEQISAKS
ncbi:PIN domain-containing protein [Paraglaciecola chathamensis]|uniref:DUF4935 domain-containing protein n=1 Tax=Paraglaciecola chathamensis S18K6 TaxID=1127672 RepID=A0AAV3V5S4_9ALTE|nr:PIN domain-containing protein [Paraglaciecola chathamensis]GAC11997.1 hypothetical protein GCHA_4071 [Paraglaciecola chathamensis S18K6]